MSQWDASLEAVKTRDNLLYYKLRDRIQNGEEEGELEFGVSEIIDGNGQKRVLYVVQDGKTVQLDSLYDSDRLLDVWYEGLDSIGYMTKVIFCGIGNGMYVRKLLERADSTVRILVYEPSTALFCFAISNFDLTDILLNERVQIIVSDIGTERIEEALYRFVDYRDLKKLIYQVYPNYELLWIHEVKHMDEEIQLMYNSIRATQDVLGRAGISYVSNIVVNFPNFLKGKSLIDLYRIIPKDIPIIIVASGPSLDKNIEELKAAKGKCFLISADSAVKALLKHNIIPDMFVSVDAIKRMDNFVDDRIFDIPLVCELNSNYLLLQKHCGIKFFINDMNGHVNAFFSDKNIYFPAFTTGGSVANTACSICTSMGFTTIIMVGQDLAYTGNKTHSVDTYRGSKKTDVTRLDGFFINGYYGDQVKTSYEFQLYLKWFEEEIIRHPEITFIDATEGGALIRGAQNMELKKAIDRYCIKAIDVGEFLAATEKMLVGEAENEFRDYLKRIPIQLQELQEVAKKAVGYYDKMIDMAYQNKYHSSQFKKYFAKAKELGIYLEKEPVMYYVFNYMQAKTTEVLDDIYEMESDERREVITVCEKGGNYLKDIIKTIEVLIPPFKSELSKLDME